MAMMENNANHNKYKSLFDEPILTTEERIALAQSREKNNEYRTNSYLPMNDNGNDGRNIGMANNNSNNVNNQPPRASVSYRQNVITGFGNNLTEFADAQDDALEDIVTAMATNENDNKSEDDTEMNEAEFRRLYHVKPKVCKKQTRQKKLKRKYTKQEKKKNKRKQAITSSEKKAMCDWSASARVIHKTCKNTVQF